jgi:hypothetical protein
MTDSLGCTDTACMLISLCRSLNVSTEIKEVYIYPNPAQQYVLIERNGLVGPQKLNIIDALGRQIDAQNLITNQEKINVHSWPTGICYIQIQSTKDLIQTKKLIMHRE